MADERTSISLQEEVRDELRRYKADDGLTYDEAIARLLMEVNWIEDSSKILSTKTENEKNQ